MYNFSINFNSAHKRTLYFQSEKEKKACLNALMKAINYRICQDFYQIDYSQLIGKGSYGEVYKGFCRQTGMKVAIKVLSKERMTFSDLEQAMSEF